MATPDCNTLWSAGKVIHGYTMLEEAHEGSNSVWGKAKSPTGQTVFFKKYTSPSSMFDDWYQGYVDYQKEIKRRIDQISITDSKGRNTGPTYRFIEFFEQMGPDGVPEDQKCQDYYQVLEYIDGAKDLATYLESPDTTWNDRKTFASVFMFAMKTLHSDQVKIIHTDLKPKNILLIPTQKSDGSSTYQIKIIDLDVSLLSDKRAPWHETGEYIGSPGYYSPEHLRGQVPTEKSDVFTCGLILYEILATEGHPYNGISELAKYEEYSVPVPHLRGTYGSSEKDAAVANMLHRMLDPNPDNRPTAIEVQRVLIGGGNVARTRQPSSPTATSTARPTQTHIQVPASSPTVPTQPSRSTPVPVPAPAPTSVSASATIPTSASEPIQPVQPPRSFAFCKLKGSCSSDGIRVFANLRIGYKFLEMIEPEAKRYYSREHFIILCHDNKWFVKHCAPAGENKTALNGALVTGEMELHNGDVITACSQDASKTIMPLTVEIGG